MALDKTQVKMTSVGKSFLETEMIVLGICIVIFHFLISGLLSPSLYPGRSGYGIPVTLPSVRSTAMEGKQAQSVERGSTIGI